MRFISHPHCKVYMRNEKLKLEIFLIVQKSLCHVYDKGTVLCVKKTDYLNSPAGSE